MADQDLDDVAERLYALAPEEFTAARDAAAKDSGDKELKKAVKALRRPSVSAWVVNLLARQQPELLEQLLELGPALAEAQRAGEGDALRELGQQRRRLVTAVAGTAAGLADRPLSAQVRAEVEQTLEAALADPPTAEAVRSGRLVRALEHSGFGGVDLEGAVAAQPVGTAGRRPAPAREDPAALEAEALAAASALDDAVRACEQSVTGGEQAAARRREAEQAAASAAEQVRALEDQLAAARERERSTRTAAVAAARAAEQAEAEAERRRAAVAAAQDAAETARAALDRARRG